MNQKTLTAIACFALACAGSAAAQTTSGATSATSSDRAASASKHSTKRHAAKAARSDSANAGNATPSGGLMNSKDVAPGTYNASGGAVPKTSDPAQTRNTRDGRPLSGSAAASGTGR